MSGFYLFLFVLIYKNIRQDKLENAKYIKKVDRAREVKFWSENDTNWLKVAASLASEQHKLIAMHWWCIIDSDLKDQTVMSVLHSVTFLTKIFFSCT